MINQTIVQILSDPTYEPPEAILGLGLNEGSLENILRQLPHKICVAFAVGEAKLVLPIFESEFPNDDRPRRAIEAAEEWLKDPSATNRSLAEVSANIAYNSVILNNTAADSAADAAHYAASAVYSGSYAIYATSAAASIVLFMARFSHDVEHSEKDQFLRLFELLRRK